MKELVETATSWHSLPIGALVFALTFGFAPGFIIRVLMLIYPKSDPRRRELIAELYMLGRVERLLFVGEQLETALMDGIPTRVNHIISRIKVRLPWLWVESMTVKTSSGYSVSHFGPNRCFRWSPHVLQTRRAFGVGMWTMRTQISSRREQKLQFNGVKRIGAQIDYSQDKILAGNDDMLRLLTRLTEHQLPSPAN